MEDGVEFVQVLVSSTACCLVADAGQLSSLNAQAPRILSLLLVCHYEIKAGVDRMRNIFLTCHVLDVCLHASAAVPDALQPAVSRLSTGPPSRVECFGHLINLAGASLAAGKLM